MTKLTTRDGRALKRIWTALCVATVLASSCTTVVPTTSVELHLSTVVADSAAGRIGITMNYLTDEGSLQGIAELGVTYLRYPGGEKSDNYLWSKAPYDRAAPRFARTSTEDWPSADPRFAAADRTTPVSGVLDFDEFMEIALATGAAPVIVVAFDSMYKPAGPGGRAPTKEELIENAVSWVRYANNVHNYGIRLWELGNESYHPGSYNGRAPSAEQYRADAREFAAAMKAVDPSIEIGVNGDSSWWRALLAEGGDLIDFLSVHTYPTWDTTSYTDYLSMSQSEATRAVREATSASAAAGPEVTVALTEYNAIYWGNGAGWANENHMGHAIAVFELTGAHLLMPDVEPILYWATRWVDSDEPVYNALTDDGELTPTGHALALWNRFLRAEMVAVSVPDAAEAYLRAWASASDRSVSVFLVNRSDSERSVDLTGLPVGASVHRASRLSASSPADTEVVSADLDPHGVLQSGRQGAGRRRLALPPFSITAVEFDIR